MKGGVKSLLFALFLFLVLLFGRGALEAKTPEQFWHLASDAFFVPGALLTGMGLLVLFSGEGVFDMLHFGMQKLFSLWQKEEKRQKQPKTYYDFLESKPKVPAPLGMFLVGALCLVLAGLALVLYLKSAGQ